MNDPHNITHRRLRRRHPKRLAIAVAIAAVAMASSVAAAQDGPSTVEPVDVAVASYASDYDVTLQEAQRRLDRIGALQETMAAIRRVEAARLAGWGIDHARVFTDGSGSPATSHRARPRPASPTPPPTWRSASVPRTPTANCKPPSKGSSNVAIPRATSPANRKGNVDYKCTSGFAAQRSGQGAYGILTAGHCGDKVRNESYTVSMRNITLPYINGWASVSADAQFHSIPTGSAHELRAEYRCNSVPRRAWCDVSGTTPRDEMINDYICHTGRNSGFTCGDVVDISYKPKHSTACYSRHDLPIACNNTFVRVEGTSLRSCGGDSGGPWYRNGSAYGIHKGSTSDDDCERTGIFAYFSAIDEVENFLGVQVLTEDPGTID